MYVIVAKKKVSGVSRGYKREDNTVVETVKLPPEERVDGAYEVALAAKLNELANEGERDGHHEIVQVLWRNDD
jgi:hypothetical protein